MAEETLNQNGATEVRAAGPRMAACQADPLSPDALPALSQDRVERAADLLLI